jgi:hypothetical protein
MRERIRPKWTRNYDARSQQWALMEFAEGDSRETSFHFSEHWWSHSALQQGSAMLWVRSWFFQFLEVLVRYSEAIKRLMSEMSRKAIKQGARRRSQIWMSMMAKSLQNGSVRLLGREYEREEDPTEVL